MTTRKQCNVPNLDALDKSELMLFWSNARTIKKARELFPTRPKGFYRASKDLANYAANKATAMSCRENGSIQTALKYEAICDKIYAALPYWARW